MSYYDQHQAPGAYPPPGTAYPPPQSYPPPVEGFKQGPYVAPPPPVGYPVMGGAEYSHPPPTSVETKSKGDGFWKGCCAALCCCCVLDACF